MLQSYRNKFIVRRKQLNENVSRKSCLISNINQFSLLYYFQLVSLSEYSE